MNHEDLDNINIKEELEFNDGVGDVLTQKEQYKFSWRKTIIVSLVGLVGVIMLTFGILEIGKAIINIDKVDSVSVEEKPLDVIMEEVNNNTWNALPEDDVNVKIEIKTPELNPAIETLPVKIEPQVVEKRSPVSSKPSSINSSQPVKVSAPTKKVIYRVIAGSFSNFNNANRELQRIKSLGFNGYVWSLTSASNKISYKVQLGAFSSQESAQILVSQLKKKNISSFISVN
ncbi:MAG: SPOR domain-containing protein [Candidatus Margulisiibacteriota bacterium]